MRAQLISWLTEDITPEVRKSRNPEAALLKFAQEKNLPPAQLEALGQLYNTAATTAYLEKSANRGGNFHIVEVPDLVKKYLEVRPTAPVTKTASPVSIPWENTGDLGNIADLPSCFRGFMELPVTWDNESAQPIVIKLASAKQSEWEASHRLVEIENAKQAMFNLEEDLRSELDQVRSLFRFGNPPAFDQVESDALMLHGDACKLACAAVVQWLDQSNIKVARAKDAGRKRLVDDSQPLLQKLAKVQELLDYRREIGAELEKLAISGQPSHAGQPASQGVSSETGFKTDDQINDEGHTDATRATATRGYDSHADTSDNAWANGRYRQPGIGAVGKDDWIMSKAPEQASRGIEHAGNLMDQAGGRLESLFGDRFRKVLEDRDNRDQRHIDTSMNNARRQALVQNLMLTDEVLSEADPERVVALYNTFAEAMPDIAMDANVMRVALRSGIQHDGVAPFDLKQMMDTQMANQQKEINRRWLDANDYKGKDLGDSKPKGRA